MQVITMKDIAYIKQKIWNKLYSYKEEKFSNKFVKIIMEIVIGVIISVIAGYILYKFNMN